MATVGVALNTIRLYEISCAADADFIARLERWTAATPYKNKGATE